ncbi:Uma2 family endonuclease, partial [Streptococcus suis]
KASFNLSIEEAKPFMAIEYVCNSSQERDYEEKFEIYRDTLHVPYYLTHEPDDLRLHHYDPSGGYVRVAANEHGRFAIPEMETEVGLVDGWAR